MPLAATFADLPGATWWYLALYLVTWVVHVIFMGYVLAGSAWLAAGILFKNPESRGPFEPLLREWLPFMLSLAITAGVAPLLFIQILYRTQFYTANLLAFHRWMAVLPVLIIGFYLLYLLKTRWAQKRSRASDTVCAIVTAACFLFIAWSWTENHLLSLADQQMWSQQYASGAILFRSSQLLPRLAMWFSGMFPILAVWLSWQLWWPNRFNANQDIPNTRQAAMIGLAGFTMTASCAGLYWMTMPADHRTALIGTPVIGFWIPTLIGGLGLAGVFALQYRSQTLSREGLLVASVLTVVGATGVAGLREAIRLQSLDLEALTPIHHDAANVGGLGVFVVFTLINTALITWCLRIALRAGDERPDQRPSL